MSPQWPSWSWAKLPLETAIETDAKSESSPYFRRLADAGNQAMEYDISITRGEQVKEIRVSGRTRRFRAPSSHRVDWSDISRTPDGEEKTYHHIKTLEILNRRHSHSDSSDEHKMQVRDNCAYQAQYPCYEDRHSNSWQLKVDSDHTSRKIEKHAGDLL